MMKLASLALLFSLALVGGTANAQVLNTSSSVNVNGSASTGADDTSVSADADTSVDADSNTSDSSDDSNGDTGMGSGTSADATTGSAIGFSILRSEIDESADYVVTNASSVRTSASLESYAGATVRADERLDSLEVKDGSMDMEYRKPAKFLWIFPASLKAHITVTEQGEISARYPWYAFLFSIDESRSALEAEIRDEIKSLDASAQAGADAEVSGTASTGVQGDSMSSRWARIIEAVYIAVSGDARVDASAQASS